MKRTNLSNFIKNLKELKSNPMVVYKRTIIELIYAILWQMAKYQITDTAQSRASIIKKFADKYGFNPIELDEEYHWWESRYKEHREWELEKSDLTETIDNKNYKLTITSKEEPVYLQEVEGMVASEFHAKNTGRDNSQFKPRHITYVVSLINNGNFGSIEKLDYGKLVDKLAEDIENQLFK